MDTWQRRTLYYVLAIAGVIAAYTLLYDYAMTAFDGRPRTLLQSLAVVVETFTTTGFGTDAPWSSPELLVLVIAMDITGVALIFLALPAFVFPLFEERFATAAPSRIDLAGHVVICGHSPRGRTLITELDAREVPYVVVEADRERADDLHDDGVTVIHGDPELPEALDRACVGRARAVVADADDETNASIALAATDAADGSDPTSAVGTTPATDTEATTTGKAITTAETTATDTEATTTAQATTTGEADSTATAGVEPTAEDTIPSVESGDTLVITFVEDDTLAEYHRYAGADHVFSPRRLVGESLADTVTTAITEDLDDAVEIGGEFEIAELPVQAGCEIAGVRLADSGLRERTGANVVGAWLRGEFVSPPPPDAYLDEHSLLLVAGREDQLEALKTLTLTETRRRRRGPVIVAGYGEVGATAAAGVRAGGFDTSVVDIRDGPGVNVVGNAAETAVLREAGIAEASAVVLALPNDTLTVFATLVIRELDPAISVLVRAEETESTRKLYRAGADYVLATATVSGRMLASTILDEEVISFDNQVEVIRTDAPAFAGRTLREANVRARTGCTVIAVERDDEVLTDIDPDFRLRASDELVIVGTDADVTTFAATAE